MNNVLVGGPFRVALLAEFRHRGSTEESLVGPTVRIVAREAVTGLDGLVYDRRLGDSLFVAELAQLGLLSRKLESMFFNAAHLVAGVAGIDVHRSVENAIILGLGVAFGSDAAFLGDRRRRSGRLGRTTGFRRRRRSRRRFGRYRRRRDSLGPLGLCICRVGCLCQSRPDSHE